MGGARKNGPLGLHIKGEIIFYHTSFFVGSYVLVIKQSQVQVPAGVAGEFFILGSVLTL